MQLNEIISYINDQFREDLIPGGEDEPADYIAVSPADWCELARFLYHDDKLKFDSMMCITGVDYGEEENLAVIYNLHSMTHAHKLEVRMPVSKADPKVPSVEQIWRIADWFEREVYDMYGITFDGHRDHRRILLPEDWEGFPLRKDYVFPDLYHGIVVPKMKEGWE
ncbi:MAG: NADH-quinone oxidoreductase subunit C [Candidatus Marinimicrobia bacterium]|jgi:NADH-quinone oxidoreductase subunit C|nr:NADH-quinone oxidoreductase subunit C [Candidatus Neomarinimicrobiota bacterium]|tara:strand:- start:514 stop:1011 length:498 start_codon:yes stop_codon:yes gene_type:complete